MQVVDVEFQQMATYTPPLYTESKNFLACLSDGGIEDFPKGSMYAHVGRVVSNNGSEIKICYQYTPDNCANCTVDCPFKSKKGTER